MWVMTGGPEDRPNDSKMVRFAYKQPDTVNAMLQAVELDDAHHAVTAILMIIHRIPFRIA